jgi:hypothetical protein
MTDTTTTERPYHYDAYGIPNIYVANLPPPPETGFISFPNVNDLHDCIAYNVALTEGRLTGLELRTQRTHLGLTPDELAKKLDNTFTADLIRTAEDGATFLSEEQETLLRMAVLTHVDPKHSWRSLDVRLRLKQCRFDRGYTYVWRPETETYVLDLNL